MKKIRKTKVAKESEHVFDGKKQVYTTPKLVVHSGADFVRKLGPAQACSPSPDFY